MRNVGVASEPIPASEERRGILVLQCTLSGSLCGESGRIYSFRTTSTRAVLRWEHVYLSDAPRHSATRSGILPKVWNGSGAGHTRIGTSDGMDVSDASRNRANGSR